MFNKKKTFIFLERAYAAVWIRQQKNENNQQHDNVAKAMSKATQCQDSGEVSFFYDLFQSRWNCFSAYVRGIKCVRVC